ncbi:MAG: TonB-dependent receptor [Flavobacteriia bacterium]|nr:TonB-dependent receptor [Flavobacteriia bacterium]
MKFLSRTCFFAFIISLSVFNSLWGQEVWVEDGLSGEPLENVSVFSENGTQNTLTDGLGKADLENFPREGLVYFSLLGYQDVSLPIFEMLEGKKIIKMTSEDEVLEEVVLSVARSQSTRNKIAEQVGIIDQKEIALAGVSTGAELLEISPNIRIQKSQGGAGSPVIRGFEANRVLIVVDGVRMNNAIYRSGHLQNAITIDPHNIDRVEVTFGSSSVGYGSDALGGVIHYYTKSPQLNQSNRVQSEFSSSFNHANRSFVNNSTTSISQKNWGSLTSVSYSNFGDIRIGKNRAHGFQDWGLTPYFSLNTRNHYNATPIPSSKPEIQKNTAYDQFDVFQKFLLRLPKDMFLNLNLQYSESSDIDRYDKLVEQRNGTLRFSEWYYGPQKRFFLSPQLKFFMGKNWLKKGTLTAAYQNVEESRIDRKFGSLTRSHQIENVNVFSLNADFFGKLSKNHSFSYGLEWTHNQVQSQGFSVDLVLDLEDIIGFTNRQNIPSRYPSEGSCTSSYAAYINWIYDQNERFTLNGGLRYTGSNVSARWNDSALVDKILSTVDLQSDALTYTLAMTYRPNQKWQINSLISSGFRNPNIDDIGKIRESNGILLVPNSFLKPEYAYTFESGTKFTTPDKKNFIDLRAYITMVSRHIVRSDFTVFSDQSTEDENTILYNGEKVITQANKNLGDRLIYGATLQAKLNLSSKLDLDGGLTYTAANHHSDYGPMPSIAPLFGTLSLTHQQKNWNTLLIWKFSDAKAPIDYSWGGEDGLIETPVVDPNAPQEIDRYYGMPSWNILSLISQYQYRKNIILNFGLKNIFDLHYRTFASGISEPGRSLQLGIKVKI